MEDLWVTMSSMRSVPRLYNENKHNFSVTLNFNNITYTAAVFLGIEEAFDTTWQFGL
jgi:hypothetical protein